MPAACHCCPYDHRLEHAVLKAQAGSLCQCKHNSVLPHSLVQLVHCRALFSIGHLLPHVCGLTLHFADLQAQQRTHTQHQYFDFPLAACLFHRWMHFVCLHTHTQRQHPPCKLFACHLLLIAVPTVTRLRMLPSAQDMLNKVANCCCC